jgi:hypothetical protein
MTTSFRNQVEQFIELGDKTILSPKEKLLRFNLSKEIAQNFAMLEEDLFKKICFNSIIIKYFIKQSEDIFQQACAKKIVIPVSKNLLRSIQNEETFWSYVDLLNQKNHPQLKEIIQIMEENPNIFKHIFISDVRAFWSNISFKIQNQFKFNTHFSLSDEFENLFLSYHFQKGNYSEIFSVQNTQKIYSLFDTASEDKILTCLYFLEQNQKNYLLEKNFYKNIENKIFPYIEKIENPIKILARLQRNIVFDYFLKYPDFSSQKHPVEIDGIMYHLNSVQYIFLYVFYNKLSYQNSSLSFKKIQYFENLLLQPIEKKDLFFKENIHITDFCYETKNPLGFYYLFQFNKISTKTQYQNLNLFAKNFSKLSKNNPTFLEQWATYSLCSLNIHQLLEFQDFFDQLPLKDKNVIVDKILQKEILNQQLSTKYSSTIYKL